MTQGPFPWKLYATAFVVIVLFALAPLISVAVSSWIAEANGCVLNEADSHPCPVWGVDLGGLLVIMFVMGWFMLATIPLGGGALIVWLVLVLIHYLAWRRRQKAPT
jgi:purine-cytosine permease-like protein